MRPIFWICLLPLIALLAQAPDKVREPARLPSKVVLDNKKVRVSEITYAPGAPRERHIRASDQVIVFLDDCRYERLDSQTKEKTIRERKAGEVIWHDRGEDAPQLTNLGTKTYRTLLVELK